MDFPHKGPIMRSFDISPVINLNKLFDKDLRYRWFEITLHAYEIRVMFIARAKCSRQQTFRGSPWRVLFVSCFTVVIAKLCAVSCDNWLCFN